MDVSWPELGLDVEPAVTVGEDYRTTLLPYDIKPQVTGLSTGTTAGKVLTDSSAHFLSAFGFVIPEAQRAAAIVDLTIHNRTTGATCTGIKILSDTTLTCAGDQDAATVPGLAGGLKTGLDGTYVLEADGTPQKADDWGPGDRYEVQGDDQALGTLVVEAYADLAGQLANSEAGDFAAPLPLVGLSPRQLTPQFADTAVAMGALREALQKTGKGDADTGKITGAAPATLQALVAKMRTDLDAPLTATTAKYQTRAGGTRDVAHLVLKLGALTRSGGAEIDVDGDENGDVAVRLPVGPDGLPLASTPGTAPGLPFTWDSTAQLDLAVPLDLGIDPNDITVLSSTGVSALHAKANGTDLDFTGSYGGTELTIGAKAEADRQARPAVGHRHRGPRGQRHGDRADAGPGRGLRERDRARRLQGRVHHGPGRPGRRAPRLRRQRRLVRGDGDHGHHAHLRHGADQRQVGRRYLLPRHLADRARRRCRPRQGRAWPRAPVLTNTTDSATCTVDSVTTTTATCAAALSGTGTGPKTWNAGDTWTASAGPGLYAPGAGFDKLDLVTGSDTVRNTTTGKTCTISTVTADRLVCADPAVAWTVGDAYELGGASMVKADLSYTLLSGADARLDSADASEVTFLEGLAGQLKAGSTVDCGGTKGAVCARLAVSSTDDENTDGTVTKGRYLGTLSYATDLSTQTKKVPAALTTAQQGGEPLDFGLVDLGLPFLPTLVDGYLDGNATGQSVGLVGSDLAAGADVTDGLEEVASALSGLGDGLQNQGSAGALKTQLTTLVADGLKANEKAKKLGNVTVTLTCGTSACTDGAGVGTISDVRVQVPVGANLKSGATAPEKGCTNCGTAAPVQVPFDFGVPGLQVSSAAELPSKVGWSASLDFGLNREDGPYLGAGAAGGQVQVGARVQLPETTGTCKAGITTDEERAEAAAPAGTASSKPSEYEAKRCIDVKLGLLQATLYDGATEPTGDVDGWDAVTTPTGNAHLHDRTRTDLLTTVDLESADGGSRLRLDDLLLDEEATAVVVDADANVDGWVVTDNDLVGALSLPKMVGSLHLQQDSRSANPVEQLEYRDMYMDLNTFWGTFGPVLKDIGAITKPIAPFIDTLTQPIPVISDVSEKTGNGKVTVYDMLEIALARARGKAKTPKQEKAADMVRTFLSVMKTIDGLGGLQAGTPGIMGFGEISSGTGQGDSAGIRGTGGFKVDTQGMTGTCGAKGDDGKKLPSNCTRSTVRAVNGAFSSRPVFGQSGNNVSKTETVKPLRDCAAQCVGKDLNRTATKQTTKGLTGYGLPTFPFLSNASEVYGMLLGAQADLVHMDFGVLHADAALSMSLGPFMAGPVPISIEVGLAFSVDARLVMGYDTAGLSQFGGGVLEGMYLDDLDDNGKDVPEVRFLATASLGAAISVAVFKVGLRGSVTLGLLFDLQDPQPDGKMRFAELASLGRDPWCMFDVKGTMSLALGFFVEINMLFWSKTWNYTLFKYGPVTLFEAKCDPPKPVLATVVGSNLRLNLGTNAVDRTFMADEVDESFDVRQTGARSVSVTAFGIQQDFDVPTGGRITAAAGTGDDYLVFGDGTDASGALVPFDLPVTASGGTGRDRIEAGAGDDDLSGGDGDDIVRAGGGKDTVNGDAGEDSLDGGLGDDTVNGGADDDALTGGAGSDTLDAGSGDDSAAGGPGLNPVLATAAAAKRFPQDATKRAALQDALQDKADLVIGGAGDDEVSGLFGDDVLFGDTPTGAASPSGGAVATECAASGDGGADRIEGEFGADQVFGGGGPDRIKGGRDGDLLCGGAGDDLLEGDLATAGAPGYDDDLRGGDGADTVYGYGGKDTLSGGAGADLLSGGEGDDRLAGGTGPDLLQGDAGTDLILGDTGTFASGAAYDAAKRQVTGVDVGTDSDTGTTSCAAAVAFVNGLADLDGDGVAGAADTGYLAGVRVTGGKVDVDRRGAYTASGSLGDRLVAGGLLDVNGDGTVDGDDDGLVQLPATRPSAGDGNADCLSGGAGNDAVLGGGAADVVSGDEGDDLVQGGTGDDTVRGAAGDDTVHGDAGDDTGFGDSGADAMYGDTGDDALRGGIGNDLVEGGPGADALFGDTQDDVLIGGTSKAGVDDAADALQGGSGNDVLIGDNGTATLTVPGWTPYDLPRTTGTPVPASRYGGDTLDGGPDADRLYAGGGDDTASGDSATGVAGRDWVEGGPGADTLSGGGEADGIIGGSSWADAVDAEVEVGGALRGDVISGGDGDDVVAGDNATVAGTDVTRLNDLVAPAEDSADDLVSGGDTISGGRGRDVVEAGGGNDTVNGDEDADVLQGNAGRDTVDGGLGDDDVLGGSDAAGRLDTGDVLRGSDGVDVLLGDNGTIGAGRVVTRFDDAKTADADDDLVSGGDVVSGGRGTDVLQGQGGNDVLHGDDDADQLQGNAGSDELYGDAGTDALVGGSTVAGVVDADVAGRGDVLRGGSEDDVLLGDNARPGTAPMTYLLYEVPVAPAQPDARFAGRDVLYGDAGNDALAAQSGDDLLSGGDGDDRAQGGAGDDRVAGDGGTDELAGGSTEHWAGTTPVRTDLRGVRDGADVVRGGSGEAAWALDASDTGTAVDRRDVLLGDNGHVVRTADGLYVDPQVVLHDVRVVGAAAPDPATAGRDDLAGGPDRDLLLGQDGDDALAGGTGDDYLEGGGGKDVLVGQEDADDLVGGSSVKADGIVGAGGFPTGTSVADDADRLSGGPGDDDLAGDNAAVVRPADSRQWKLLSPTTGPLLVRDVRVPGTAEKAGAFGNDVLDGGDGRDELHGELGADTIAGRAGDDTVLGDLAKVVTTVAAGPAKTLTGDAPFISRVVGTPGTLVRTVTLLSGELAYDDMITGGAGDDVVHSGGGADQVWGWGRTAAGTSPDLDGLLTGCAARSAVACGDKDVLFTGDGDDKVWGGPDRDHVYGGYGKDWLDVVTTQAGDPAYDYTGADMLYGGYDADAMQADISRPSPNDVDKLIDAAGVFNLYLVCEGAYGGNSVMRLPSPGMTTFMTNLATAHGLTGGAKARELGLVTTADVSKNANPPYPGTPGNFTCTG